PGTFSSPPPAVQTTWRADAVKDGRRSADAPHAAVARPRLDGGEHGVTLTIRRPPIYPQSNGCYKLTRRPPLPHRLQHDIGRANAWRLIAGRHDGVDLRERLDLLAPQLGIAEHLAQRLREFFRCAVLLQEFGDDVLADHEVGQYHRIHLDRPPQYPGLHRTGPVGRHH